MKDSLVLLGALALSAASVAALAHEQPTYRLTLVLKENASRAMRFQDLNDKGEIIGNRSNPDFTETASVWRGSAFEPLNPLVSSNNVFASAINDRSEILVRYFDAQRSEWRGAILRGTQIVPIEVRPGEQILGVGDLNNRRQAVVSTFLPDFSVSTFVWQPAGQRRPLDAPPSVPDAAPARINDWGDVVGTGSADAGFVPVVWFQDGTSTIIDAVPPEAIGLAGVDINNRTAVLTHLAFPFGESSIVRIWFQGTITDFKRLPETTNAVPFDFNNRGAVVGSSSYPESDPRAPVATIWRRGVASNLNTLIAADDPLQPFVSLGAALMINDRGQILVQGRDSRDDPFATSHYLLTPEL